MLLIKSVVQKFKHIPPIESGWDIHLYNGGAVIAECDIKTNKIFVWKQFKDIDTQRFLFFPKRNNYVLNFCTMVRMVIK